MLLGRVRRPSIGSLQALEMERPSPKIIKDNPLSVYETTLMKLKEGSQRCQSMPMPPADAMSTDVSCVTASDSPQTTAAGCSSTNSSPNSIEEQSNAVSFPSEQRNKIPSVLYLFSKYKSSKNAPSSSDDEAMLIETVCSSAGSSPSVSNSQFMRSRRLQFPKECFDSEMMI